MFLRQSTASQEVTLGRFVDSTTGDSEMTALSIANTDIKVWKTGATTLASKNSGGATHIANGIYYCVLDATDTDTIGPLELHVHVSGALYIVKLCHVLDEAVYDVLFGTTALSTLGGTAQTGDSYAVVNSGTFGNSALNTLLSTVAGYVDTEVAAIKAKTDLIPGTVDGKTFIQGWGLIMAALLGKMSGGGTTTVIFRSVNDTANRIEASVDSDGNRTAITLNP